MQTMPIPSLYSTTSCGHLSDVYSEFGPVPSPAPTPIRLKVVNRSTCSAPTPRIDLENVDRFGAQRRIGGPEGSDECPHELLNAEGACMVCGVVCQTLYNNDHGYTTSHSMPRQNERSILKELENLTLPDDIK